MQLNNSSAVLGPVAHTAYPSACGPRACMPLCKLMIQQRQGMQTLCDLTFVLTCVSALFVPVHACRSV